MMPNNKTLTFIDDLLLFDDNVVTVLRNTSFSEEQRNFLLNLPRQRGKKPDEVFPVPHLRYAYVQNAIYLTQGSLERIANVLPNLFHSYGKKNRMFACGGVALPNIAHVFAYATKERAVKLPDQFESVYQTVVTGMWDNRELRNYTPAQPGSPASTHTLSNYVIIIEGGQLDEAFAFFTKLGFFKRQEGLPNGRVAYHHLFDGGISMEKIEEEYLRDNRTSEFGCYMSDQQLLETLHTP